MNHKNSKVPITLNKAVIYARYSSAAQNEQTIEGQLRVCNEYAENNNFLVVKTYIDKAKTGTNDKRPEFQQMIADAKRNLFNLVIVYTIDRFSRNRGDHVIYKRQLEVYGIKVLSAMEQINDSEEGALYEGILEIYSEMYSRKLSKRIRYAFQDSLTRGSAWGGVQLLGYKIENKRYVVDEETAPIVKMVFEKLATGVSLKDVYAELNNEGFRTNKGKPFSINSFQHAVRNPRYCGRYSFNGIEYPDRYPPIISEDLFYRVQNLLDEKQHCNASGKAKIPFFLSSKAFCLECGKKLLGVSTTKRSTGKRHYYYTCSNRYNKNLCSKNTELKDDLELTICETIIKILQKPKLTTIIARTAAQEYDDNRIYDRIVALEGKLSEIEVKLEDYTNTLTKTKNQSVFNRVEACSIELEEYKEVLQNELNRLRFIHRLPHSESDFIQFLTKNANGDIKDVQYRKRLLKTLISCAYVGDDRILIFFALLPIDKPLFSDIVPNKIKRVVSTPNHSGSHTKPNSPPTPQLCELP